MDCATFCFSSENDSLDKPIKVSVLIVNYNGQELLSACLQALQQQTYQPHQVIVVDNGSIDGSRAFLEAYDWQVLQTLFLETNTGFSGGNNAGLELVSGEVVALLNTDTEVDPNWITAALPHFRTETVGMVACKTVRWGRERTIDKVGHLMYPDGLNRGRGTGQPDDGTFDRAEEVLWPDGSAGFYAVRMLAEIGFLEEQFFLYGEDAELGMRARWAGWRCIYEPHSKVRHHQSAGLGKFSPQKIYYIERNRIWLLCKTFPLSMLLHSPLYTVWRYAMNLVSLVSGRGSAASFQQAHSATTLALSLIKANWHGLLGARQMLIKRRSYPRRIKSAEMKHLLRIWRISATEITLQD